MAHERATMERQEHMEYGFEEGAQLSSERILELYEHTDHDLIVVINGSGTDVGKTRLEQFLIRELTKQKIRTDSVYDTRKKDIEERQRNAPTEGETGYKKRRVFFKTIEGMTYHSTQAFVDLSRNPDYVVPDLFIAIYRPDKPFSTQNGLVPVGHIIIRNEGAGDAPGKIRE